MRIASNISEYFQPKNGFQLVPLGDEGYLDASMIVLMLGKNWGGNNVDKIRALTHWVTSYPKNIPCYIVGCETTIPSKSLADKSFYGYRHKERDDAVRALCDEVLTRSSSIGVRGEITYAYLTDMLGYEKDSIDIIYTEDSDDNLAKMHRFLNKNNPQLNRFEKEFLKFQAQPHIIYERPINFEKNIVITPPYVTTTDEAARLNSDLRIDGEAKTLWCETSKLYHDFLLSERADAFVCALLPFAMRIRRDIVCEVPVSEQLLHNINEILVPNLCAHDSRLFRTKIIASSDSASLICGEAVATGMSCGVDSFYTVNTYKSSNFKSMNLTHLYCGNYLYGNDGPIYERARSVAQDLGLPLVQTTTNLSEVFSLPHLPTHFFKTMFGVLALRKLFRKYFYSSSEDFGGFDLKNSSIKDTVSIELLLLYVFNSSDFQLMTGGGGSTRLEKTRSICGLTTANKFLNVCLYPNRKNNCGKCAKCMRTLLMLDLLGSLDLFQNAFDIDGYKRNRHDSFVYLVKHKHSKMLSVVYEHFQITEKALIGKAEEVAKCE